MRSSAATKRAHAVTGDEERAAKICRRDAEGQPLPFLRKAHSLISSCPAEIGGWTADGCSFVVHDADKFAKTVIPTVYKHSNWSSFVRQLNFYGFRKVKSEALTSDCEFKHPFFVRGKPELIASIKKPESGELSPLE